MKVTIRLDDDLAREAKAMAQRSDTTFRAVVNAALQRGLRAGSARARPAKAYACPTFAMGEAAAGLKLDKALALADSLADLETARDLEQRK